MRQDGLEFFVKVNGRYVKEYNHIDHSIFLEGRKGSSYTIEVVNNTPTRRRVVLSVDGLNVLSGDSNWEKGYVVDPWSRLEVPGWRINSDKVAEFKFGSVGSSYNQHNDNGNKANVGVIGCMVYNEKPAFHYDYSYTPPITPYWNYTWPTININSVGGGTYGALMNAGAGGTTLNAGGRGLSSSVGCFSAKSDYSQSLGTEWGQETQFKTKEVSYDFYDSVASTILLYYDDAKGLARRGIHVDNGNYATATPQAFPGYSDGCPPPKYVRGR